jgi:hypothetical protein
MRGRHPFRHLGLLAVTPGVNEFQWLAFVILPAVVGAFGLIAPWLARRFIP